MPTTDDNKTERMMTTTTFRLVHDDASGILREAAKKELRRDDGLAALAARSLVRVRVSG